MEGNQLKEVLARFGHEDFREGHREPIEAVLRGEDAVTRQRDYSFAVQRREAVRLVG